MWLDPSWEDIPTALPEHAHTQAEEGASGKICHPQERGDLTCPRKGLEKQVGNK